MAHLPVPVAWLGVVGQRRKLARNRRQNMEVAGVEEDGEQRSLQRLKWARWPHRREAEALEGSPSPGRGWSYCGD